jgi:tetratricopeptide (TPR) repeat protein
MELLFLEADLYMLQKEYNKAKAIYQQIIDEDPRHSWIPYLNLSWISSEQEKTFDFEYIKQAYEMFPEKKEILLPLVWYSMEQNRGQDYEQDLKQYLEEHPDDPDIRLLYLTVSSTMNNPAKYKAALWQLYNQYPGNANIAQYLCWYLFGMEDFEDVRTVLQRFENEAGTMEWIDFYRGAMASLQGNREKAVEHYASSLEIEERWETHYNLGLLHLKTGYRDRALEQFRRAEALVKRSETTLRSNKKHAGIYIKIAMIHFLNEDYEQAERQLNFGLEIDSGNLEGHLLAKKLEAATKR